MDSNVKDNSLEKNRSVRHYIRIVCMSVTMFCNIKTKLQSIGKAK